MELWGETLTITTVFFLFLALALALGFEFVNGFHDTANAVATVIYTHTLKPNYAVVWSGVWNLLGVLASGGLVAYSIIALLPVELVINVGSSAGFAMVFALLVSAIVWNLGTWYLGLPASSSHTLIGSILGVGIAHSMMSPGMAFGEGVNWGKAGEVGMSLLVSPIFGFGCAAILLLTAKQLIKKPELYTAPEGNQPPPFWIRCILMLTCTGVSFFHGSNDGQKGMGLIMLILIGIVPGAFALNMAAQKSEIEQVVTHSREVQTVLQKSAGSATMTKEEAIKEIPSYIKGLTPLSEKTYAALAVINQSISGIGAMGNFHELTEPQRRGLRTDIYMVDEGLGKILKGKKVADPAEASHLDAYKKELDGVTKYIPLWVKIAVAVALGLGTMIGWKRIVVTVGEKIGKEHLTYAQGASAELVAMATIGAADWFGLPVSTTHVLSSGVAGTMAANGSGLQMNTLRNLLLAWILTLPVCIFLGASLFAGCLYILLNVFGLK